MILPVILVAILSGCGHKSPKPPTGEFLIHNQPKGVAVCSDIQTAKPCAAVPIEKTHKYIMFHPKTWESIQNYIDALIRKIQENNQAEYQLHQTEDRQILASGIYISAPQIKWFKRHLKTLEHNTLIQAVP
ncbi:hypothetical protein ACES2L_06085 [Bdellovibrio bacteriovorus]